MNGRLIQKSIGLKQIRNPGSSQELSEPLPKKNLKSVKILKTFTHGTIQQSNRKVVIPEMHHATLNLISTFELITVLLFDGTHTHVLSLCVSIVEWTESHYMYEWTNRRHLSLIHS